MPLGGSIGPDALLSWQMLLAGFLGVSVAYTVLRARWINL